MARDATESSCGGCTGRMICLAVQLDILEQPSIPFSGTEVMNPIPQTPEDLVFGREDLRAGCREGIY
jgi:hypothetical protein